MTLRRFGHVNVSMTLTTLFSECLGVSEELSVLGPEANDAWFAGCKKLVIKFFRGEQGEVIEGKTSRDEKAENVSSPCCLTSFYRSPATLQLKA